ncbi:MAG TPA: ATP-binding protein [Solimonas sp.]|nr:ATP-binding protein [Solimonas sp.]
MGSDPSTLDLIVRLGSREERAEGARALAARVGADQLILFVADRELGVLLPASGFPQTLDGGPTWRTFLRRCNAPGRHQAPVELPRGSFRPALALAQHNAAVVFIGGAPRDDETALVAQLLPLLAAMLSCEQAVLSTTGEAAEAHAAVERATALASALEAARAEGVKLNAELHDEQRGKDVFLAMLAHELRNPLAPLVTSIDLLRRGGLDPAGVELQLGMMTRQVGQLTSLVEDLLDVSRVSRGLIELRREALWLAQPLRVAVETVRPLLESRQHRFQLTLDEEALAVNGDPVRLTQIFANLLHNAAKYSDPGGSLVLSASREGDEAVVRVTDSGIGIAPEMLPHIFDLFSQAPVAIDRAQGGLGIGLTLVRTLVELHGGRVQASSAGVGHGSTFTVHLPLASAPPAVIPVQVPAAGQPVRCLRVLVVDDNQDAADSLSSLLQLLGHQAEVAYDGLNALRVAGDLRPELVLLDIGLPHLDGYEVARRLRRLGWSGMRLVALTGYGTDNDRQRSRQAGFDEHVAKPVGFETLRAIVSRCAGGRPAA